MGLGVPTVAEIAAFYVPRLDNALDSIALPAATVAEATGSTVLSLLAIFLPVSAIAAVVALLVLGSKKIHRRLKTSKA